MPPYYRVITYSFIGSDKSAGKTTALNFIYGKMAVERRKTVCLTSVGINGESVDFFDGRPKPVVRIYSGGLFLSASENMAAFSREFKCIRTFSPPRFSKRYTLGRALMDFEAVVEGPNTASEITGFKDALAGMFPDTVLLIDGSADRLFLGRPEISDAFYFSVLLTDEPAQSRRAMNLALPLSFPVLDGDAAVNVKKHLTGGVKSILFSKEWKPIYQGDSIPFMDEALKKVFLRERESARFLYLNGALSNGLSMFFEKSGNITFILDNFTLFQCGGSEGSLSSAMDIRLLNSPRVKGIFIKNDTGREPELYFPPGVPVTDLFETEKRIHSRNG